MVFSDFEIVDINLKMPFQDFERELQDIVDNYSEPMTFNIKQLRTRLGKAMYKLIVENDSSDNINIVAECDDVNGDIYFHPLKLSNMNESFFMYPIKRRDVVTKVALAVEELYKIKRQEVIEKTRKKEEI